MQLRSGIIAAATSSVPASVVLPTPSFGSTNLLGWWDVTQTSFVYYDTVGTPTVAAIEDLSGNGNGWLQGDKSLQPTKGANNGPLFDGTTMNMDCVIKSLFNGLSQVSVYALVRPVAGTAKRTLFATSEGTTNAPATAASIASGGTGYAVNDYVTMTGGTGTQAVVKVTSVDGSGVILTANLVVPGTYTTPPTNPASTTGGTGTGATFNLTVAARGSGSAADRFTYYFASGSTSRKSYITTSALDGAQNTTSTSNGTSLGAANGGALSDTTTKHRVGVELDYTGVTAVADFYHDGSHDGSQQTWTPLETAPWKLNTIDSVALKLGNNTAVSAPLLGELIAMVALAEIPSSSRRTQIDTYLAGL